MKYYVLEGSFKDIQPNKEVLGKVIKDHHTYLQNGFDSGQVLFAGPKVGSNGGIIVLKCDDDTGIDSFINNDPLVIAGIQGYRISEFKMFEAQSYIKDWFK